MYTSVDALAHWHIAHPAKLGNERDSIHRPFEAFVQHELAVIFTLCLLWKSAPSASFPRSLDNLPALCQRWGATTWHSAHTRAHAQWKVSNVHGVVARRGV